MRSCFLLDAIFGVDVGFTMQVVYFKTGASEHVGLCTHDGRIDFCRLSREFKLDPTTVKLNGILLSLVKPLSEETWENIEKYFKTNGEPVGGKNDHVIVTGETAVPAVSTGMFHARISLFCVIFPCRFLLQT